MGSVAAPASVPSAYDLCVSGGHVSHAPWSASAVWGGVSNILGNTPSWYRSRGPGQDRENQGVAGTGAGAWPGAAGGPLGLAGGQGAPRPFGAGAGRRPTSAATQRNIQTLQARRAAQPLETLERLIKGRATTGQIDKCFRDHVWGTEMRKQRAGAIEMVKATNPLALEAAITSVSCSAGRPSRSQSARDIDIGHMYVLDGPHTPEGSHSGSKLHRCFSQFSLGCSPQLPLQLLLRHAELIQMLPYARFWDVCAWTLRVQRAAASPPDALSDAVVGPGVPPSAGQGSLGSAGPLLGNGPEHVDARTWQDLSVHGFFAKLWTVMVDGIPAGWVDRRCVRRVCDLVRCLRRSGALPVGVTVAARPEHRQIHVYVDPGRLLFPAIVFEHYAALQEASLDHLSLEEMTRQGVIDWLCPAEATDVTHTLLATGRSDVELQLSVGKRPTHVVPHPALQFDAVTGSLPNLTHDSLARATLTDAHIKATQAPYESDILNRTPHRLRSVVAQVPAVSTFVARLRAPKAQCLGCNVMDYSMLINGLTVEDPNALGAPLVSSNYPTLESRVQYLHHPSKNATTVILPSVASVAAVSAAATPLGLSLASTGRTAQDSGKGSVPGPSGAGGTSAPGAVAGSAGGRAARAQLAGVQTPAQAEAMAEATAVAVVSAVLAAGSGTLGTGLGGVPQERITVPSEDVGGRRESDTRKLDRIGLAPVGAEIMPGQTVIGVVSGMSMRMSGQAQAQAAAGAGRLDAQAVPPKGKTARQWKEESEAAARAAAQDVKMGGVYMSVSAGPQAEAAAAATAAAAEERAHRTQVDRSIESIREPGDVVRSQIRVPADGKPIAQVIVSSFRQMRQGSKGTTHHGQKAVVSEIIPISDLPSNAFSGARLQKATSPNAYPGRQTPGQLADGLHGLARVLDPDRVKDTANPFERCRDTYRAIAETLVSRGIDRLGRVWMRNPMDGRLIESPIYCGLIYYMVLGIHNAEDTAHARVFGPRNPWNRQPVGSSKRLGGQRLGRMEVATLSGNSAYRFLRGRMREEADYAWSFICLFCGSPDCVVSWTQQSTYCRNCRHAEGVHAVRGVVSGRLALEEPEVFGVASYPLLRPTGEHLDRATLNLTVAHTPHVAIK